MRGAGSTERPGVPGEERAALVPFHRTTAWSPVGKRNESCLGSCSKGLMRWVREEGGSRGAPGSGKARWGVPLHRSGGLNPRQGLFDQGAVSGEPGRSDRFSAETEIMVHAIRK